ncbi:S-layer homology domain-containing protein [Paenibacillus thalictri]|uniref:SLH domain-containing protein n=1 Tax=Paenibacillus thalictri TaxID=2527873 RepID=A0A4Q9DTE0_9BACL|nr:S-layer homology domain-containing protein [Paenibacillus thalictri]TBL79546.1 hypothetical protein EYB31_11625 [Paenibacillus thalictri]
MNKAFSRKSFRLGILLLLPLLLLGGTLLVQADSGSWTDGNHAEVDWYVNYSNYTTFTIDSPAKLAGIAKLVNNGTTDFQGKILVVDADGLAGKDMNMSAYTWVPIGTKDRPFKGSLIAKIGGPVTISGINVNGSYSYAGFIGNMDNATVGGFVLSGTITANSAGEMYAGGLAGRVKSSGGGSGSYIYDVSTNVSLDVTVTGSTYAGYAGGIAGSASGRIYNVSNGAPVTVTGVTYQAAAGGIAGAAEGTLTLNTVANKQTAAVSVKNSGAAAAGGIVGQANAGLLMAEGNSLITNSGSVKSDGTTAYSGGIIGRLAAAADTVTFSEQTANSGQVLVDASNSTEAYAGSLAGLYEKDLSIGFNYAGSGLISNQAKDRVYTGGLVGRVKGNLTLSGSFDNSADVEAAASGTGGTYTGAVAGYVDGNMTAAPGSKIKNQGKVTVSGSASTVYTGGFFGAAGGQVSFGSTLPGAYVTSGAIAVDGKSDLYTGGIIAGQAYTKTAGNISNTGDITVKGDKALYTGGYIGKLSAAGADLSGETYAKTIRVTGNATQNTDYASGIFTGGLVGLVEQAAVMDGNAFTGTLNVTGGEFTYTGGIAGYLGAAGTISGAKAGNTAAIQATVDSAGSVGGIAGYAAGSVLSSAPEFIAIRAQGQNGLAGRVGAIAGETAPTATIGSGSSPILVKHVSLTSASGNTRLGGAIGENRSGAVYILMPLTDPGELTLQSSGDDSFVGGVFGINSASLAAANLSDIRNIKIVTSGARAQAGGISGQNAGTLNGLAILNPDISAEGPGSIAGLLAGRSTGSIVQPKVFSEDGGNPKLALSGPQSVGGGIAGVLENAALSGNGVDATIADALITATGDGNIAGSIAGKSILSDLDSVVSDSPVITIGGAGSSAGGIAGESTGAGHHIRSGIVLKPMITASGANSRVGGVAGYAETELSGPTVAAYDGEYAILKISGGNSLAGGITGKAAGASISGNGSSPNIENMLIQLLQAADGSTAGGVSGWNETTPIRNVYAVNMKITDNAPHSTAGGLTGYNKGSVTAVIADNYMSDISITANSSSMSSILGGLIGLNDTRDGGVDNGDPKTAVSSIQNNRSLGSLTVNSSQSKVGGLVGENRSVVANTIISDGFRIVSQGNQNTVGGLVGLNAKTVYYSFANAGFSAGGIQTVAGGLVGENSGLVASSYIDKDISADIGGTDAGYGYLGGLIGKNSGTVERSYTSSAVASSGSYTNTGGLIGWQDGGSVDSSYAAKQVLAQGAQSFAGGFFGRFTGGTVKDSYSAGQITGENGAYAGAFAGRYDTANKELLENSYYVKDETQGINSGLLDFGAGTYYELKLYGRLSPILSGSLADREAFKALSRWDFSSEHKIWTYGSVHADYYPYPELVLEAGSGGGSTLPEVNANISWYTKNKESLRFYIGTEAELAGLAAVVNGSVTGLARFDFAGRVVEITAPIRIQSAQWAPIGSSEQNAFQGRFEGKNYLISGLRADKPDFSGLFGVAGSSSVINNVKLEPVSVTGSGRVGALAAWNKGEITGVSVSLLSGGYVAGGTYTGGVVGENQGTIKQAAVSVDATGEIRSQASGSSVGGVLGYGSAGSLSDTTITLNGGSIKGSGSGSNTGGAAGKAGANHTFSAIRLAAHNEGITNPVNIAGNGNAGGIIGSKTGKETAEWDIADVTVEQAVISAASGGNAGGIAGSLDKAALLNGTFKGKLTLSADGGNVGGIVGKSLDSVIYKAASAPDITLSASTGTNYAGGIAGIVENTAEQAFDFGKPLPVYRGITLSKTEGGTIRILGTGNLADVSAGGIAGLNKASSLYFTSSSAGIEASGVKTANLGGVAGWNQGDILNGSGTSAITASSSSIYNTGGVAGLSSGGRIFYSQAMSGSTLNISGVVANQGVTPVARAGGFAGRLADTIVRNSASETTVKVASDNPYATLYTGGFAGLLESGGNGNGTVERSYAKGAVTVSGKAGSYAGGFAGDIDQYTIQEAYASGAVSNTAIDARSGGFAGTIDQSAAISKAYVVTNSVEAIGAHGATRSYAGGFAGYNNGSLTETYATAAHTASLASGSNSYAGSFIGYNFRDGKVNGSYYEGDAGIGYGTAVQGLTRTDLSVQDSFAEWDFATDHAFWAYLEGGNGGKPVLKSISSWTFAPDVSFMMEGASVNGLTISSERQLGAAVMLLNDTDLSFYRLYNKNAVQKPALAKLTLGRDMNLSGALWIPFEAFTGEWDGAGKTIAGLNYYGKALDNYGFVRTNQGTIRNTVFNDARIAAGSNVGIVAGTNGENGVISNVTVSGKVSGSGDYVGGAAGKSIGALSGISTGTLEVSGRNVVAGVAGSAKQLTNIRAGDISVTAVRHAGGIAGEASGISNVTAGSVTVRGESALGGIAGAVTGAVSGIKAASVAVEATSGTAAGVVPETGYLIKDVELSAVNIKGSAYIGGIAGKTTAAISQASVQGELWIRDGAAGGIAGRNEGSMDRARFKGTISGGGAAAGGLAGENMARIESSYAAGSIGIKKDAALVKIGGIAGTSGPAAVIESSFSAAELRAEADVVSAGGIAGENEGNLHGVLNAGNIQALGQSYARAGGITGYALAGSMNNVLSYGQVEGTINGLLIYKKTFYGGIAGQVADQVSITNAFGDRQMLMENIVYNDSAGQFVRSVPGKAENVKTGALVKAALYEGLDPSIWQASAGFYPRLTQFDGVDVAKLAAAAIVLNDQDTAYHVKSGYTLTSDPAIEWKTVNKAGELQLKASLRQESRTITVNKMASLYADTALKPTGLSTGTFKDTVSITLTTNEPNGIIYYTLNGNLPSEESQRYSGPIALTQTTTVQAVVAAEGKNNSEAVRAVYTKESPVGGGSGGSGGGGGGGAWSAGSTSNILVNGKAASIGSENTESTGGKVNTVMTVQEDALKKLLLQEKGNQPEIAVVFDKKSDIWTVELTGVLIREIADRKAVLRIENGAASYRIPAEQLSQEAYIPKIGSPTVTGDVRVRIEIASLEEAEARQLEQAATSGGYSFVAAPTAFHATYILGNYVGKLGPFNAFVERTLPLPEYGAGAGKLAAVMIAPDGSISPVPAQTVRSGGKSAVVIRSMASNGVFAVVSSGTAFNDVGQHWAQEAIRDLGSRFIISGTGESQFEPDRSMTRAEFAAIAVKALGLPDREGSTESRFPDVKAEDWYAPYIQNAYRYGLISGLADGSFGPQDTINREQAMTIIARVMNLTGIQLGVVDGEAEQLLAGFTDADRISGYAKAGIAASVKAGLVSGKSEGAIAPADPMTRAEVATILRKLLQKSGLID